MRVLAGVLALLLSTRPAGGAGGTTVRCRAPRARVALCTSKSLLPGLAVVSDAEAMVDAFGQSTSGDLLSANAEDTVLSLDEVDGLVDDIVGWTSRMPREEAKATASRYEPRGVYCSRALNMKSIVCVNFDLDYTLVQYQVDNWEAAAYRYAKLKLEELGFPVSGLEFTTELIVRGCIVDKVRGNIVKVDRFGYVRRAIHGTRKLSRKEVHDMYGRLTVDLRNTQRWSFANTLFSISEGCLYAQLVDKLDDGTLVTESRPPFNDSRCSTYENLWAACAKALFKAHVNSALKADVLADPSHFVLRDADLPATLLDMKASGKRLTLVSNSDWTYARPMMTYIFDPFLPGGTTWRDLFDVVIVSARKPAFFSESMPLYEIVDEDTGMMLERFKLETGKVYAGGSARMVEKLFACERDQLLYVGDHIYTDANLVKATMRWRTALVIQELEDEVRALEEGTRALGGPEATLVRMNNAPARSVARACAVARGRRPAERVRWPPQPRGVRDGQDWQESEEAPGQMAPPPGGGGPLGIVRPR